MSSSTPRSIRFRAWNLLLLVPFLMLVTPWFNHRDPRLFGMPFFYWIQFVSVFVGVIAVAIVFFTTRAADGAAAPVEVPDVDELDEGASR